MTSWARHQASGLYILIYITYTYLYIWFDNISDSLVNISGLIIDTAYYPVSGLIIDTAITLYLVWLWTLCYLISGLVLDTMLPYIWFGIRHCTALSQVWLCAPYFWFGYRHHYLVSGLIINTTRTLSECLVRDIITLSHTYPVSGLVMDTILPYLWFGKIVFGWYRNHCWKLV